jgi:uracil-DNA glycosylase
LKKKGADEHSKRVINESKPDSHRSAADYLPEKVTLSTMRDAVQHCKGCDLYKAATQAVLGEGPKRAKIVFIGEQPGDVEDREGRPFVGPAGKLLRKALGEAGIPESEAYLTNAVKHFKYEWRGKRRLHSKPRRIEVLACMPWLEAELNVIKPSIIVCLGATAAQALFGPKFRLTQHRGETIASPLAKYVVATVHPSSILRARDDESRRAQMEEFIKDLRAVAKLLQNDEPEI